MPEIGKPQAGRNPFGQISMASKEIKSARKKQSVGDALNELSGNEIDEQKFVDRKTHNKLGKDGFLKLLAHQLNNQDPLKPMDQKQFAADLAQFSQLEQLTNMNTKFDKMGENAPQETKFYGASFIGKEILTNGSSVHYNGVDRAIDIPFYLENSARDVLINVYDSKHQLISQLKASNLGKGQNKLAWDGKQLDGVRAVKDDYTFEVRAWDQEMNEFKAKTKSAGLVTGVSFKNGETILTLENGKEVFLRDVESFKQAAAKQIDSMQNKMPALQKKATQSYNNINEQM